MAFATGPVLRYVGLGRYATVGPTVYVGADQVFTIPGDYVTDLATVPRVFWAILPPHGVYERAAVLHDWAITDGIPAGLLTSRDADGLFRRVAREGGAGWVLRWVLWWGVRVGALFNGRRRQGWWRDLPVFAPLTVLLVAVACGTVYVLDHGAHWLLGLL